MRIVRHCGSASFVAAAVLTAMGCAIGKNLDLGQGRISNDASTPFSRAEHCGNGIDDDQDGRIDNGCPCAPSETQACFTGAHANRRVGACADGIQTCRAIGVEWGDWGNSECEGDRTPEPEQCDGLDHDCDGTRDEDCPCTAGETRDCGLELLSAPCTGGMQQCAATGLWSACEGAILPALEVCGDLIDNDCDGEVDLGCDCIPEPERCRDAIDNDCDGITDEPACTPDWLFDAGTPVDVGLPSGEIVDIQGNTSQFCAHYADGRVFCWGSNAFGGLGIGDVSLEYSATPVQPIDGVRLFAMGNDAVACAAPPPGIRCWGRKVFASRTSSGYENVEWRPFSPPEAAGVSSADIAELAVGHDQYMFRRHDGTIWGWGYDQDGSLGDGPEVAPLNRLVQVSGIDDAIDLDAYNRTVCAVRRGGSVWCWGEGAHGQCGPIEGSYAHSPARIIGIDDAVSVKIGRYMGCALRANGEVSCWGIVGALGDGSPLNSSEYATVPRNVPGLTLVEALESSTVASCAIRAGGELWCWGAYDFLGAPEYATPRRIMGVGEVIDVALGNLPGRPSGTEVGAICVLERGNRVRCWGENRYGQNGDGTTTPASAPVDVIGLR